MQPILHPNPQQTVVALLQRGHQQADAPGVKYRIPPLNLLGQHAPRLGRGQGKIRYGHDRGQIPRRLDPRPRNVLAVQSRDDDPPQHTGRDIVRVSLHSHALPQNLLPIQPHPAQLGTGGQASD